VLHHLPTPQQINAIDYSMYFQPSLDTGKYQLFQCYYREFVFYFPSQETHFYNLPRHTFLITPLPEEKYYSVLFFDKQTFLAFLLILAF